jgi:hypothetical protein
MRKILVLISVILMFVITGCSSQTNSATGDKYENSERVTGLIYMASGTQGDGPDDATVIIEPTDSDPTGEPGASTLLPWTKTTTGTQGSKVSMTVESLASDGTVECQIMFDNIIIHNKASGDHVKVTCEGTLTLD